MMQYVCFRKRWIFFQDMILLEEKPVKLLSLSLWILLPLLSLMSQSNLELVDTLYQQLKFLFGNILKPFVSNILPNLA